MRGLLVLSALLPPLLATSPLADPESINGLSKRDLEAEPPLSTISASAKGADNREDQADYPPQVKAILDDIIRLDTQRQQLEVKILEKSHEAQALYGRPLYAPPRHYSLREQLHQCDTFKCRVRAVFVKGLDEIQHKLKCLEKHMKGDKHRGGFPHAQKGMMKHGCVGHGSHSPPPLPLLYGEHGAEKTWPTQHRGKHWKPHVSSRHSHFGLLAPVLIVALFLVAFIAISRRCCSKRRRAERAFRREQRATACALRRSACRQAFIARRQAFRSWIVNRCPWSREYKLERENEKRNRVQSQENLLETQMQCEIQELRNAASIVESLISAEEGRVDHSTSQGFPGIGQLSRSNSLPDYRSDAGSSTLGPPPGYDSEFDTGVADGFQYMPRNATVYTPSGTESTGSDSAGSDGVQRGSDGWKI
ncbi:MAG: hypothetical protein M1814_001010 [Vezdaea aestivalis]|nr:MAG: hypothetical protein M1814_001010 [Vezdaea aestivalis]